jgi:hypothetical protein
MGKGGEDALGEVTDGCDEGDTVDDDEQANSVLMLSTNSNAFVTPGNTIRRQTIIP